MNLINLFRWLFLNRRFGIGGDRGFRFDQRGKGFGTELAVNFQPLCRLEGFHPGKGFLSENAVSRSAGIAQRIQAGLHFLHVIPGHVGGFQLQNALAQNQFRFGLGRFRGDGFARTKVILQQGFGQICPIRPRTILDTGFHHAIVEPTGFNRIAAADVNAHMTRTEQQDSRNVRQGCNFAVLASLGLAPSKHSACGFIRATVGTVLVHEFCAAVQIVQNARAAVRPEEALDHSNTVHANPLGGNRRLVFRCSGRTVMRRVLLGLAVQQGRGADVNTCSVPIGHSNHGNDECHELRCSKHDLHPLFGVLLVQFGQTRNGSQQGQNARQKGRAADHQPIHVTDHGRSADGCNRRLRNRLDSADSRRLDPILEIHFSISPFCLSGNSMNSL